LLSFFLGACLLMPARWTLAGECTDGVSCYCDSTNDPTLLMCEDWEAPTLYENVDVGGEAPNWGPWWDNTGSPTRRGFNSYWTRTYGVGSGETLWQAGEPANPIHGITCSNASGCRVGEYVSAAQGTVIDGSGERDRWQANHFANVDIVRQNDIGDENPTWSSYPIFDGKQSMMQRVPAGRTTGIPGVTQFNGLKTTVGITHAMMFPSNVYSSGLMNFPWKFDEWIAPGGTMPHWQYGISSCPSNPRAHPYCGFFRLEAFDAGKAECEEAIGNAEVLAGRFYCNNSLRYVADRSYDRETDWPFGEWGCSRAYITGLGTPSLELWVKLMTPDGSEEVTVAHIRNFDGTLLAEPGFTGYSWNSYANANSGAGGGIPTTETSGRGIDHVHIRGGSAGECAGGDCVPVSCEAIGFGVGAGTPRPPLPGGDLATPTKPRAPILLDN